MKIITILEVNELGVLFRCEKEFILVPPANLTDAPSAYPVGILQAAPDEYWEGIKEHGERKLLQ